MKDRFLKTTGKYSLSKRVYAYDAVALLVTLGVIWGNELFDLPHVFFGAPETPTNWSEAIFESVLITLFGCLIVFLTHKLFKRMKYLEGILPVCASCRKIRDENANWQPIEEYVRDRSDAEFSHGICPDCARKLYPQYFDPTHDDRS